MLGWTPDGAEILYASNAGQFSARFDTIYAIKPKGGEPRLLQLGMANAISYGPHGGVVIGRNTNILDMSHWKRYRGGAAGHLWCNIDGTGTFQRLLQLDSNIANPCWVGERIYFLSDHNGVGNLYSCTPAGTDLRQHSERQSFYARNLSSDGQRLVYHAGADLYLFDPVTQRSRHLAVELPSQRTQCNRKFVSAAHYLDTYALHPQGHGLALTTRGKAFSMGNWEGPVIQHGEPDGVRYRFLEWLNDGKRFVAICDTPGREALVVFNPEEASDPNILTELEFGRATHLAVSPTDDKVALTNHRNELLVVDLEAATLHILDRSDDGAIRGTTWSPDGLWLAYSFPISAQKRAIKLCNLESGETHQVTNPILKDYGPSFDPEGKYLYFLGERIFNPIYDRAHFHLDFSRGIKPYAIMLRRDQKSPFLPKSHAPEEKEGNGKKIQNAANGSGEQIIDDKEKSKEPASIRIDLEGIKERALPFPVSEGRYWAIRGIKGKALFHFSPSDGASPGLPDIHKPKGSINSYDFEIYKTERLIDGVQDFELSRDYKYLLYNTHQQLRVVKAGERLRSENGDNSGRESGWLNLGRIKVLVQPSAEWKQMFAEAWRLQREHFWTEDMSGIDWEAIYEQYAPLVERVSSRSELSDLLWELQGELGTSHAHEKGGEYRHGPYYQQGFLGVDWTYDEESKRYRIAHIVKGDISDSKATSPLTSPGLNVVEGDAVLAINGRHMSFTCTPQSLLVNQADNEVQLLIEGESSKETSVIVVKALSEETSARYREWVESNRNFVHTASKQRVGYIHIPDMRVGGLAEFHRGYLTEYDYPALIIDVRWNAGGRVSGLLLEKLARHRLGYKFSRWQQPDPYPVESPHGPMVALTNENTSSDGEIFGHSFKLMGLGPLVGKRTWGGVIGVSSRHHLVDGTITTQPEYSFWFKDVGWNVENYGTDPDIEVDIAPQDCKNCVDPQLERAIAEALRLIEERPALEPKPGVRPRLGLKGHV